MMFIIACFQLCDSPIVDYIEEDQEITIASPTTLWHLDRIDQAELPLDQKYSSPGDGSDVDIYIVDTGTNMCVCACAYVRACMRARVCYALSSMHI